MGARAAITPPRFAARSLSWNVPETQPMAWAASSPTPSAMKTPPMVHGFTFGTRHYRSMKPVAIDHYAAAARDAFATGEEKEAAKEAQRVLRLAPGHADALGIIGDLHDRYAAAARDALAAGDAPSALENAQNAINLKGRSSPAISLLAEAKTLEKAQKQSAE